MAESGVLFFGDHDWKATHFPWPFWAVKRGPTAEGTNCGLEKITVNTVHTCTAVADSVDVYEVVVPMMANHCDISKGTELIANWPNRTAAAPKRKDPKLTLSTWVHQAAKKSRT